MFVSSSAEFRIIFALYSSIFLVDWSTFDQRKLEHEIIGFYFYSDRLFCKVNEIELIKYTFFFCIWAICSVLDWLLMSEIISMVRCLCSAVGCVPCMRIASNYFYMERSHVVHMGMIIWNIINWKARCLNVNGAAIALTTTRRYQMRYNFRFSQDNIFMSYTRIMLKCIYIVLSWFI